MLEFSTAKKFLLWFVALATSLAAVPSLVTLAGYSLPAGIPAPEINLGLDLAGGSQILLEADPSQVARQRLESMEEDVRRVMRLAKPSIKIGDLSTECVREFFRAISMHSGMTLHIHKIAGENDHHVCEAIFKGFGRALYQATRRTERRGSTSTKGSRD